MKSYKLRFVGVLVILLLLGLTVFFGPFRTTLDNRGRARMMKEELEQLQEAPTRIKTVTNMLERMDARVGFNDSLRIGQNDLFIFISEEAQSKMVRVTEMPESHIYEEQGMRIETHLFRIEGSYAQLLTMAFEVESNLKAYSVASVNFERFKDKQKKTYRLVMELVIQGVRMK